MLHNNILLVDDDEDDHLLFVEAIKEVSGTVQCHTACNGLEAMIHLKTACPCPSLIFLDLNMPLMNGLECLEQIKSEESLKHIPIIIFSTSNNPKDQQRTREMGARMFFTKASDYQLLKSILLEILDKYFAV